MMIQNSEKVVEMGRTSSQTELETPVIIKRNNQEQNTNNQSEISDKFETPTFIHKNEGPAAGSNHSSNIHSTVQIQHSQPDNKEDINKFISQFENAKDKTERSQVCK